MDLVQFEQFLWLADSAVLISGAPIRYTPCDLITYHWTRMDHMLMKPHPYHSLSSRHFIHKFSKEIYPL